MRESTREWVEKAEGDFLSAAREAQAVPPNYDVSTFLAQQCAEKYLKARLVEADIAFPKTHDLVAILNLVRPLEPTWDHLQTALDALTSLGVEVRYPGCNADRDDAEEALRTAATVRDLVRAAIGLGAAPGAT